MHIYIYIYQLTHRVQLIKSLVSPCSKGLTYNISQSLCVRFMQECLLSSAGDCLPLTTTAPQWSKNRGKLIVSHNIARPALHEMPRLLNVRNTVIVYVNDNGTIDSLFHDVIEGYHDNDYGWSFYESCTRCIMMTSSNGNIFRVTGPLCREFTGHRWIPRTKASDAGRWYFLWSAPK